MAESQHSSIIPFYGHIGSELNSVCWVYKIHVNELE